MIQSQLFYLPIQIKLKVNEISLTSTDSRRSLDIAMTLLNREYYRSNTQKSMKRVVFRSGEHIYGHSDLISIADLLTSRPRFTDSNGEFLMELSLSRIRTDVEKDILIQHRLFGSFRQKDSSNIPQLTSS